MATARSRPRRSHRRTLSTDHRQNPQSSSYKSVAVSTPQSVVPGVVSRPVLYLSRPSEPRLREVLARARATVPTYPEVGETRVERPPPGYRHDRYEECIGTGEDVFLRAVEGLRSWAVHRGAGVNVYPEGEPIEQGATVLLLLRTGSAWVLAPCRIVWVEEEKDRSGFAYGTLPGHPERGESAFVVRQRPSGEVTFEITAFSHPAAMLVRAGKPVARMIQRRVTERYLQALRRIATSL
jgi:uncharacterized protein (UPF0548 family)